MTGSDPLTKELNKVIRAYDICYRNIIPKTELEACAPGVFWDNDVLVMFKQSGILFRPIQVYKYFSRFDGRGSHSVDINIPELRKRIGNYFGLGQEARLPLTYFSVIEPMIECTSNASFVSFNCLLENYGKTWVLLR